MSHLLAISVGPVQEFIAAARRTRDLWFGSHLLSEISRAVAKSVEADGGELIFPANSDAGNVANVILAKLPTGEPRNVAAKAKQAAQKQWLEFADKAQREASGVIRQEIWDDQVKDVIEFYSAWVASSTDFSADRGNVMRLLAGRKNCRDFLPAKGRAGVPKSSLDGQRESVLKDPDREHWPERFRARLRIREGEQLDVVGLVKRISGGQQSYPSVARIAADPWVRGNKHREEFQVVLRECKNLGSDVVRHFYQGDFPQFGDFPYEGTAVYPSRHREWQEESELSPDQLESLLEALNRLPPPEPYLAVLVADGDRMGAAISQLGSPDALEFSSALAGFADKARAIVTNHNGVLVYAGGDDVLAFLPVDRCLCCARKLHEEFGKQFSRLETQLAKHGKPTLSVGIAIGHFMENLEDLLDYGRAAEKAAKIPDRNGLAVHLHKRGGSPTKFRARWDENENPAEQLARHAKLIQNEAIPSKLPYDLRKLVELYKGWPAETSDQKQAVANAVQKDTLRMIRDKQPRSGRLYMLEIEQFVNSFAQTEDLDRFAEMLLIARHITAAMKQAGVKA